ncbi:MAG: methyltransferase-like protein [Acidimicrobiia bacterium]|nr:methyltransferase-like protein [Acidimicrobiia bacterium]
MEDSFELHRARRELFSTDLLAYDTGRPGYPRRVYELLVEHCGLGLGRRVLEIGPGTGQATGDLLDLGASVTAIELSGEFADLLQHRFAGRQLTLQVQAFEEAAVAAASVDLVVAATSFHWVPTETGLRMCADALRSDGWLALWWNVFGDPSRPDPFHEALQPVLERLAPALLNLPDAGTGDATAVPYALDTVARIGEINASARFGDVRCEVVPWTGRHTARELRSMFASFSPWLALPPTQRTAVLDAVEELAMEQFQGLVERPYLTAVYLAPRLP